MILFAVPPSTMIHVQWSDRCTQPGISWRQTVFEGGGFVSGWNFSRASFHRGTGGVVFAQRHGVSAAWRVGRHQAPRASNSPSNCIAWRHANDCIFPSHRRVNRKTRVSRDRSPNVLRARVSFISLSYAAWNHAGNKRHPPASAGVSFSTC